jgi:hypothetical protein
MRGKGKDTIASSPENLPVLTLGWHGGNSLLLKAFLILPPALALVAVTAWNAHLWQAVSAEKAKAAQESGEDRRSSELYPVRRPVKADAHDTGGLRGLPHLQNRIAEMTAAEVAETLVALASLEMDGEARERFETMLLSSLVEKDPALALATYGGRIPPESGALSRKLAAALGAWAKQNPATASAWLDQQIAAGRFDSKSLDNRSGPRIEFEAELLTVLLAIDLTAAGQRIAGLPEEQRRPTLQNIPFASLDSNTKGGYISLVRSFVPREEQPGAFSQLISEWAPHISLAEISGFLDSIHASPDERAVSARMAAHSQWKTIASMRAVTRDDLELMSDWLGRQAPEDSHRLIGEALAESAQLGRNFDFTTASRLALQHQQETGSDQVLVGFLESYAARSNLAEALPLAARISDPTMRDELVKRLQPAQAR